MRFDFDIAIVGGGPAGSSTALHLARREGVAPERVLVLDKAKHPREKPCAGAVSAWGVDALAAIGIAVDVPHVVIGGLRVFAEGHAGTHASDALGVVVRRNELDARLLARAGESGVVVRDGEGVTAIAREAGGFRLTTTTGDVTTRLIAACDGAGSTVRKLLGIRETERKGHLYVLESDATAKDDGVGARLCDFDLRVCERGVEWYYWDFPTVIDGARVVSRGIYHANFTRRSDVKDALARALEARGVAIADVKLKPFSTRPFARGSIVAVDGVALVGEACGIDATTGEGIAQAILFGGIAAHHLAQALRARSSDLTAYAHEVPRSRVGRHLLQSAWLARRVYGPNGAGYRAFLARSPHAREAGALWYGGRRLGLAAKTRLAVGLAASVLASR